MQQLPIKKLEGPQSSTWRDMREVRVGSFENVYAAGPAGGGDVLFSITLPCDRLSDNSRRGLELPHDLAGIAVHRDELPRQLAGEDQPAGRHQGAGPVRALEWKLPLRPSGQGVGGPERVAR